MISNMDDLKSLYQQMCNDPAQILSRRFNIPQNVDTHDPNAIIQHLLNSGQVSQAQLNNVMGMRNNPMIQMLMKH